MSQQTFSGSRLPVSARFPFELAKGYMNNCVVLDCTDYCLHNRRDLVKNSSKNGIRYTGRLVKMKRKEARRGMIWAVG